MPSLSKLSLTTHKTASTDVVLQLLQRGGAGGTVWNPESEDGLSDASGRPRTFDRQSAKPDGFNRMKELISDLKPAGSPLGTKWVAAVRTSMTNKRSTYNYRVHKLYDEIEDAHKKVRTFANLATKNLQKITGRERSGNIPEDQLPLADAEKTEAWDLAKDAEGPFDRWRSLVATKAAMEILASKAAERDTMMRLSPTPKKQEFIGSLMEMLDFSNQETLLDVLVDIVRAFIESPMVAKNAFINMILMGNPGVGKTRIAKAIGKVLGNLGMFIYGGKDVVESGRSDFVAQYEGQTALKTTTFLVSNLEKVVFLDEAYSLTKYDQNGQLEAYGEESTTEIVAFLSQNVGRICMICAGYEDKMSTDFLPANDGLNRRFPYQVVLENYTADQLVKIFIDNLAEAVGKPREVVNTWFTIPAKQILRTIVEEGSKKEQKVVAPSDPRFQTGELAPGQRMEEYIPYPTLHQLFDAQAGAMVNLASVAAMLLTSNEKFTLLGAPAAPGQVAFAVDYRAMYNIMLTLLQRSQYGSESVMEKVAEADAGSGLYPSVAGASEAGARNALSGMMDDDDDDESQTDGMVRPEADAARPGTAIDGPNQRLVTRKAWEFAQMQMDDLLYKTGWFIKRASTATSGKSEMFWRVPEYIRSDKEELKRKATAAAAALAEAQARRASTPSPAPSSLEGDGGGSSVDEDPTAVPRTAPRRGRSRPEGVPDLVGLT